MEKSKQSIFITGTGTDVGKTVLSLALLCRLDSEKVCYYKPVQCGGDVSNPANLPDSSQIEAWFPPIRGNIFYSYKFKNPVSPHLAAEMENVKIESQKIIEDFLKLKESYDWVIVEGAGGAFVPLNRQGYTLAQIFAALECSAVLCCSPNLGTLNHSLLSLNWLNTIEAGLLGFASCQREKKLPGIFMDNMNTIAELSGQRYLGHVPFLDELALCRPLTKENQKKISQGLLMETGI